MSTVVFANCYNLAKAISVMFQIIVVMIDLFI